MNETDRQMMQQEASRDAECEQWGAFAAGRESIRDEIRRQVLRDVFEALSPDAAWQLDDKFEHYPLDVQVKTALEQLHLQNKNFSA